MGTEIIDTTRCRDDARGTQVPGHGNGSYHPNGKPQPLHVTLVGALTAQWRAFVSTQARTGQVMGAQTIDTPWFRDDASGTAIPGYGSASNRPTNQPQPLPATLARVLFTPWLALVSAAYNRSVLSLCVLVAISLGQTAISACAQAPVGATPDVVDVRQISCEFCGFSLRPTDIIINPPPGRQFVAATRVARDNRGHIFAAPLNVAGEIAIDAGTSSTILSLGSNTPTGSHPDVIMVRVGGSDSVYVGTDDERVIVVTPDHRVGRSFRIPGSIADVAVTSNPYTMLLHFLPARNSGLSNLYLYREGGERIELWNNPATFAPHADLRLVASADQYVVIDRRKYTVDVFDGVGTHLRRFIRHWDAPALGPHVDATRASVIDAVSHSGTLFTISVAGRAAPQRQQGNGGEPATSPELVQSVSVREMHDRWVYFLEAIDLKTGELLAQVETTTPTTDGFASPQLVYQLMELADGSVAVQLWNLDLLRSP